MSTRRRDVACAGLAMGIAVVDLVLLVPLNDGRHFFFDVRDYSERLHRQRTPAELAGRPVGAPGQA